MPDPGEIEVTIADEGLVATVDAEPDSALGEKEIRENLLKALKGAGVVYGIDKRAFMDCVRLLAAGETVEEMVIARGRPPKKGQDGRIEMLVEVGERQVGQELGDGHIDFRNRGELPLAKPNQPLAREIAPIQGVPGMSVDGRGIRAPAVEKKRVRMGKSVFREGTDILAKDEGMLVELEPDKIAVLKVLDLEAVDFNSGHVKFPGLVRVAGSIGTGFKVEAESVNAGSVEPDAIIEVEESVQVTGGIMGAKIKAGGSVSAALIRKAEIECEGDLEISSEIVDSQIIAGGKVIVRGHEGRIVNSRITVGKGLESTHLISSGKVKSSIQLGGKSLPGAIPKKGLEEVRETFRKTQTTLKDLAAELKSMGAEWRATKDPGLAARIKELGQTFTKLRADLEFQEDQVYEAERAAVADNPGEAYISLTGRADRGTTIHGLHSSLVLDRQTNSFSAREHRPKGPDGRPGSWTIGIFDARTTNPT